MDQRKLRAAAVVQTLLALCLWAGACGAPPRGTAEGFETWVLIENPGGDTADVQLTYMTDSGSVPGPRLSMGPGIRKTVNVADTVKDSWGVSTKVTSTKPVVAEGAMYGASTG